MMLIAAGPRAAAPPALTVSGRQLASDGRPAFLLGVSLFDALGRVPPRDEDLDTLKAWGVRIVRVWAHWSEPIYGPNGVLTPRGRTALASLVTRLGTRGMFLELVLLRPGQLPGEKYAAFSSPDARLAAVRAIAGALKDDRNILFDLYNEHDHPDGPISHADARILRDVVKALDPARPITISSTGTHLVSPSGRIGSGEADNIGAEAGQGPGSVGVDVLSPHLPRTEDWDAATRSRVVAIRLVLRRLGMNLPIYLNEERRATPGDVLPEGAYRRALNGAQSAGAAGWLFHTAAGFDLAAKPFLLAVTPAERAALTRLAH